MNEKKTRKSPNQDKIERLNERNHELIEQMDSLKKTLFPIYAATLGTGMAIGYIVAAMVSV